jgi:transposase
MPHPPRPIRAFRLPAQRAPSFGQAAAAEAVLDRELILHLGALPLLLPLLERLGLREVVNRHCHPDGTTPGALDAGLVAGVLVLNRLLAPQPLVHVETWLAGTALPDLWGLDAPQCNDDRLARTLDALAPHREALWQDLLVAAVRAFGLDLSRLAYDLTSVAFCGAYEAADLIRFGYSRDHRPDRQQLELATTVTLDGGLPVDYRVLAGNVADRTTPVENLRRLQALLAALPARAPGAAALVVSDRAMLTLEALAAYEGSGLRYLGPLDPHLGGGAVQALLAGVSAAALAAPETALAYRPQRAAGDPAFAPYHGVQRALVLPHPEPARPPLQVRALVVWSPGKARVDAQLRAAHLERLEAALRELAGKLGRRPYTTVAAVEKRVGTVLRRHPARAYLRVSVTAGAAGEPGPALHWGRREDALAAAAALDGRYVLGTNDPTLTPDEQLATSKRRDVPEKRYALLKGPLAVRPVFLHQQERILSLVWCTMVALLVFALLEWATRRVGERDSGTILLTRFAELRVLVLHFHDGSRSRRVTGLDPFDAELLERLGWPPASRYNVVHP